MPFSPPPAPSHLHPCNTYLPAIQPPLTPQPLPAGDSCFSHLNDLVAAIRGVRRTPLAAAVRSLRKAHEQQQRQQQQQQGHWQESAKGGAQGRGWGGQGLREQDDCAIVIMDPEGPTDAQVGLLGWRELPPAGDYTKYTEYTEYTEFSPSKFCSLNLWRTRGCGPQCGLGRAGGVRGMSNVGQRAVLLAGLLTQLHSRCVVLQVAGQCERHG